MNTLSVTMILLMGFTGSLHCAGMCGPIIWVMPFQFLHGIKRWMGIFLYHFGRVSVYALLALVLHSFRSLFQPQIQQYISITLGAVLLIAGVLSFLPRSRFKINLPWAGFVTRNLGTFIGKPGLGTLFITGALNGMLPCGLVYMALSATVVADSAIQSMGLMYVFGLGTLPMLMSLTVLKSKASFIRLQHIRGMVPVIMFSFGCLFMLRGMNLGIPYLSPKVEVTQHEVKASCCHKK